jgi:hypothetical protein
MSLVSWLSGLKSSTSNRQISHQRRKVYSIPERNIALEQLESRTMLAAVMWDGEGGDFDWNNAQNWTEDTLPGTDDDVTIDFGANDFTVVISGGEFDVHSLTSNAGVNLQSTLQVETSSTFAGPVTISGQLGGTGNITVSGSAILNGELSGPVGSTILFSGSVMMPGNGVIRERDVTFAGETTWTGNGRVYTYGDVTVTNTGTWHMQPGPFETLGMLRGDGSQPILVLMNSGSIAKETGDNYAFIDATSTNTNTGSISVESGTLYLGSGGQPSSSSGTLSGATGTLLSLGGSWNISGPVTADKVEFGDSNSTVSDSYSATTQTLVYGGATVLFSGSSPAVGHLIVYGTADFGGAMSTLAVSMDAVSLFGGILRSARDLQVTGQFLFNNGSLEGVAGGGSLRILSNNAVTNNLFVRSFTLINAANMTWTGGSVQFFGATGGFINAAGATFVDQIDGTFGSADGNCLRFTNDGHFIKSGGTGITYLQMQLYNRGIVEIQQGQLYLGCGYVSTSPGSSVPPGIDYPTDHPPIIEDPNPTPLPSASPPVVIPGSYTQTVSGQLIEQIAGHSGAGTYGTPGIDYGQLVVNGDVALNGTFTVEVIGGFVPGLGQQYMAIDNRGTHPIDGTFIGLPEGSVIWAGNYGFTVSYSGGDGNDFVLTMNDFAGVYWDGEAGDNLWGNPVNWSFDMLPSANDDVTIDLGTNDFNVVVSTPGNIVKSLTSHAGLYLSGGELSVQEESLLLGNVTVANAVLGGLGNITVMGLFNLNGGTIGGSGGSLELQGDSTLGGGSIYGRTLISHGTASLVNDRTHPVYLYDDTVFDNHGTLLIGDLGWMIRGDNSSVQLLNSGSIVKPSGTGEAGLILPINSDGPITLSSGALNLGDHTAGTDSIYHGAVTAGPGTLLWLTGGNSASTFYGAFDVDHVIYYTGTAFNFYGSYHSIRTDAAAETNITGPVIGFGTLNVQGTMNIAPAVGGPVTLTFDSLNINGTLNTPDDLIVTGGFSLNGGTVAGSGTLLELQGRFHIAFRFNLRSQRDQSCGSVAG